MYRHREVIESPILGDIRLEELFQVEIVGLDEGRDGFDRFGIVVDLSLLSSESELDPESALMRGEWNIP